MRPSKLQLGGFLRVVVMVATTVVAAAIEPPAKILEGLKADAYPERVAAEKELQAWASKGGEEARQSLFKLSRNSNEPEIRRRALSALKIAVIEELTDQRPGFVGIGMVGVELSDEVEDGGFGVEVQAVNPNTPAEKAGLRVTDVILKLDGKGWNKPDAQHDFAARIGDKRGGDKIRLEVLRDGKKQEIELLLASRPWSAGIYNQNLNQGLQFRDQGLQFRGDPFAARGRFTLDDESAEKSAEDEAFQQWLGEQK